MSQWYSESFNDRLRVSLSMSDKRVDIQSPFQRIEVFDSPYWGRVLVHDGLFMTSERDEFFYHEMLVHPAMASAPSIDKVLVIGGGDGGTVREILRYPQVKEVTMVEIDAKVVEVCREHLPTIGTAWDDPRLKLRFEDGIRFVQEQPEHAFDVIVLDGSDPVGPAEGLFNQSFYEHCQRALRPGGIFVLQSESPLILEQVFYGIQHTLKQVFNQVHPYFGIVPIYGCGLWTWTWAANEGNPREAKPERQDQVAKALRYYNAEIHQAAFAIPSFVQHALNQL